MNIKSFQILFMIISLAQSFLTTTSKATLMKTTRLYFDVPDNIPLYLSGGIPVIFLGIKAAVYWR